MEAKNIQTCLSLWQRDFVLINVCQRGENEQIEKSLLDILKEMLPAIHRITESKHIVIRSQKAIPSKVENSRIGVQCAKIAPLLELHSL